MACVIVLSNKCDITRASLEADQQEPNPCYAVGTSSESPLRKLGEDVNEFVKLTKLTERSMFRSVGCIKVFC